MAQTDPASLLFAKRADQPTVREPGILSFAPPNDASSSGRFEGFYGRLYSRVIQAPRLRRAVFSLWGSADPLYELEAFIGGAVRAARNSSASPVLVDLPSGSGTLLPFLAREGFNGTVVEADLAISMLRRAVALHRASASHLRAVFIHCDALDLPLRNAVADAVVSINGLHVVPDPASFLSEVSRVTKIGGRLWLITPVDGPSARSRTILAAANALRITPRTPPTLKELRGLLATAGFSETRWHGGLSITGLECERVAAD